MIAVEGYQTGAGAQSRDVNVPPSTTGALPDASALPSIPSLDNPFNAPGPPTGTAPTPIGSAPAPLSNTTPNPPGTAPGGGGATPTPPILAPPTLFPGGLGLGLGAIPAPIPGAAPAGALAPPPAVGLAALAPGAAPIQAGNLRAPPLLISNSVGLSLGLNDNPEGTSSSRADTYAHLQTGTNISVDSVRFQGQLSSGLDLLKYARTTDQDTFNQSLLGFGLATVVQDHLFIDMRATNTQVSRLGGTAFVNPTLIPASQATQALAITVSPLLRQSFDDILDAELRYSFGTTNFSNGNAFGLFGNQNNSVQSSAVPSTTLSNTTQSDATLTLATGSRFSTFGSKFTLDVIKESAASSTAQTTQVQAIDVVQYQINPQFSLLGSFGYEDFNAQSQRGSLTRGAVYSFGGRYASSNGYVTITYGRQFGSNDVNGSGRYQITEATGVFASLDHNLTTAQQQLLTNLNSATLNANGTLINQNTLLPIALVNPAFPVVANNVFLSELFQAGVDTTLDRNSFRLVAFITNLTSALPAQANLSATAAQLSGNDTTRGVNFTWSRSLTPDLTSYASLGYTTDIAVHNKTLTADLGLNYTISGTLAAHLHYSFLNQKTDVAGAAFKRNLIEVGLNKTF
jgi:uncharacterized protein (PEP-CTERM system associated)